MAAPLSHTDENNGHAPLLFLHGLGADKRQTTSALSNLPSTRLITADLPGHGESPFTSSADSNFPAFAQQVLDLADHLQLDTFHLGGLSMGSGLALNLALKIPQRIRKLIVLRPSWLDQSQPHHLEIVPRIGQWITAHGIDIAQQKLHATAEYPDLALRVPAAAKSLDGLFTRPQAITAAPVLSAMWESRPYQDLADLRAITHPTLTIHTPDDDLHPRAIAEQTHAHLPHSSLHELPARYLQPAEHQSALRQLLTDFLV